MINQDQDYVNMGGGELRCYSAQLANKIGLVEAILVAQTQYWTARRLKGAYIEGYHWVYNSYSAWARQLGVKSAKVVATAVRHLREAGILVTDQFGGHNRSLYYRVDDDVLARLMMPKGADDNDKIDSPSCQKVRFYTRNTKDYTKKKKTNKKESRRQRGKSGFCDQTALPGGKSPKAPPKAPGGGEGEILSGQSLDNRPSCPDKAQDSISAGGLGQENSQQEPQASCEDEMQENNPKGLSRQEVADLIGLPLEQIKWSEDDRSDDRSREGGKISGRGDRTQSSVSQDRPKRRTAREFIAEIWPGEPADAGGDAGKGAAGSCWQRQLPRAGAVSQRKRCLA